MYHYLYKTTNDINGKFYVGIHSSSTIDKHYQGSGTLLKKAFLKYGKENFTTEIIKHFKNREDLCENESNIVNQKDQTPIILLLVEQHLFVVVGNILRKQRIKFLSYLKENLKIMLPIIPLTPMNLRISYPRNTKTENYHNPLKIKYLNTKQDVNDQRKLD